MQFFKILSIIGFLLIINSLLSILFDIPMLYDFLIDLMPLLLANDSNNEYYFKVVPTEPSAFDYRFLWFIAGSLLVVIGRYLNNKSK